MNLNFSLSEIKKAADWIIEISLPNKCFAFHGEMGAGKTTLITTICQQLGATQNLSSPTFSIINEYMTPGGETLYHIDLYRLKDEQEAMAAGVEECMYSGHYCFVEWPERAIAIFPESTVHCYLNSEGMDSRNLQLKL